MRDGCGRYWRVQAIDKDGDAFWQYECGTKKTAMKHAEIAVKQFSDFSDFTVEIREIEWKVIQAFVMRPGT